MSRNDQEWEPLGLIPAAGLGDRLLAFPYPKELLPIVYVAEPGGERAWPRPALHFSLEMMREAGVRRCFVVIAEWKLEIARVLGDGAEHGVALSYLIRSVPLGLADALNAAYPWVGNHDVCMALPDTIVTPRDALSRILRERLTSGADVVLGVFPTDKPEQLGPVRFEPDGRVIEVLDKPSSTSLRNTWGIAVWSPRFSTFLNDTIVAAPTTDKPTLGTVFDSALRHGMDVQCHWFEHGSFVDLGTPESLGSVILDGNGHGGAVQQHEVRRRET